LGTSYAIVEVQYIRSMPSNVYNEKCDKGATMYYADVNEGRREGERK